LILVFTHKVTPRIRYIFKQIFSRILLAEVSFTSKVEEFVAHNGPKFSYTKVPLGKEFFVRSHDLLFEQGVNDVEIQVHDWDGTACFFPSGAVSNVPFDIFAASFYLITRYEEYLPHVKDVHSRFSSENSLANKYRFLEKPVIDIWTYKFKKIFEEKYPEAFPKKREYRFVSTIDVDNAFAYKHKSLVRTFAGFFSDLLRLRLFNFWDRLLVVSRIKKDPFDTFGTILKLTKKHQVKTKVSKG